MRSGACTVQQTLTAEAASVLKHSLSLARRRGHAQATPLHVAATLLSSRTSILRRACLKSQPHKTPLHLHCRALELCFNVALNRLPTTPGPLLHGQPSLSNALIAALKRAQAHQRRGCIEQQQQQPLLTIKVELEQLVISILDDPSVSRVMREAGFSSTAVKSHIEDCSASSVFQCYSTSGGVFSSPSSPSATDTHREIINSSTFWQTQFLTYSSEQNQVLFSPLKKLSTNYLRDSASVKEDIKLVLEVFLRKRKKNSVIVGDCVSLTEGLVGELLGKLERGDVPLELKQTQFIKFQFAPVSVRLMESDDVDMKISELRRKIDSLAECGAIIYTGDLKWTVEETAFNGEGAGYSPVDHLVSEIGNLLSDYCSSNRKVWLLATANYQTYTKCLMRQPSLENQWALQAVSVPSGGLGLSLRASSFQDSRIAFSQNPPQVLEAKPILCKEEGDNFSCCPECTSNYEKEAQLFKPGQQKPLPPWLQTHGNNTNTKYELVELRRKWNRLCQSIHHNRSHSQCPTVPTMWNNQNLVGKNHSHASPSPWWASQSCNFPDPKSISFSDSRLKPNQSPSVPKFRRQKSCIMEFSIGNSNQKHQTGELSLDNLKNTEDKEVKITLALGNSSFTDSGKLKKGGEDLLKLLQENVPWQSKTIPSILEVVCQSKSINRDTWLVIQGNDTVGKRRFSLAVAESVLGSADLLLHFNMMKRDSEATPCSEIIARALKKQERVVVLVEEIEFADTKFLKFLADGFETGNFEEPRKETKNHCHAIFILTKGDTTTHKDGIVGNSDSVILMNLKVDEDHHYESFKILNAEHKRKAEWDIETVSKTRSPIVNEKKTLSRYSTSNALDLNVLANEEDESEVKLPGELSPMSSDLTRETTSDPLTTHGFLDRIKNSFIFDRNKAQDKEMAEALSSKMKCCFEEIFGVTNTVRFNVENRLLKELREGSGSFINSLFEKWLKEVFQTSLRAVYSTSGGKDIQVRLCYQGKKGVVTESGFMSSNLPKNIQISTD
ncbi:hypothetical protein K2173_016607 [Erythroxylum novogranatense]|uniref:Clp R domain-containing protein n=1 Tax=Erythroxylum novogranatense TaxID=1862640 RepID=A0AAV8SH03_9ROSI|nr:hypothetical protein K2173_016607 [Erythroxylum novogranatense]